MSDVSKINEALIAEAQEHYSEMNGLNSRAAEVMMELVAALEAQLAATRVPVQEEPNVDREAQVEAAARALDPIAWGRYDLLAYAKNPWPSRDLIVEHSLSRARAALAAVERVRAIAEQAQEVRQVRVEGAPSAVHAYAVLDVEEVLAALDGAPEPEWEYGYRGRYAVMHPTKAGQRIETPEITQRTPDNWLPEMGGIYRRRPSAPAGPWLPVEGESDD